MCAHWVAPELYQLVFRTLEVVVLVTSTLPLSALLLPSHSGMVCSSSVLTTVLLTMKRLRVPGWSGQSLAQDVDWQLQGLPLPICAWRQLTG